jgi:4'-phosphopantetheinyl transferase
MDAPVPPLVAGEVHLWRCRLPRAVDSTAWPSISPGERRRAARFVYDVDRRRFLARRSVLRALLSQYAGVAPRDLEFETTCRFCQHPDHGKPRLAAGPGVSELSFSSTSSGDLALIAVASGTELGIDAELVRELVDLDGLARQSLSPEELRVLGSLPKCIRTPALLTAWTQKEAYLKGIGRGLAGSLESVQGRMSAERLIRWPGALSRWWAGWTLHSFRPTAATVACLAVEGHLPWNRVLTLTITDALPTCPETPGEPAKRQSSKQQDE